MVKMKDFKSFARYSMNRSPFSAVVLVLAGVVFLFKLMILLNLNFVMDEFTEMNLAGLIHKGYVPFVDFHFVKPLMMSFALAPLFEFSQDTVSLLWTGRIVMFVLNGVVLVCVYYLAKDRFNETAAWLSLILILLCSTEVERSIKIRTDNVAVTLFLISLTLSLVGSRTWWRELISGFAIGLAPLVTQKAIFFVAAVGSVLVWRAVFGKDLYRRSLRLFITGFGIPGLLTLTYLFAFSDIWAFVEANVIQAAGTVATSYEFLFDFYGILFFRDPVFWVLSLISLIVGLGTIDWRDRSIPIFWAALIVTLGILIYNRPWPFIFVSVIPLLGMVTGSRIETIYSKLKTPMVRASFLAVLMAVLSLGIVIRAPKLLAPTNFSQEQVISAAEDILETDHTYFDGLGMLFNRRQADTTNLVRRNLEMFRSDPDKEQDLIENLKKNRCALLIYNYRLKRMPKAFQQFVTQNYLPVTNLIWTCGSTLEFDTENCRDATLIASGNYRVSFSDSLQWVEIDEKRIPVNHPEIVLKEGRHTVCTNHSGKVRIQYFRKGANEWKTKESPEWLFVPYSY